MVSVFGLEISYFFFYWTLGIIFSTIFYFLFGKLFFKKSLLFLLVFSVVVLLTETLGAKLMYIFENFEYVKNHGVKFQQGFSLFGSIFLLPALFLVRPYRKEYFKYLSFAYAGMLIELAFYRIGCTFNHCCMGIPWAKGPYIYFEHRVPVTQIEILLDLLLFGAIILLFVFKVDFKISTATFMIGHGIIRFVLELYRIRTPIVGPFSIAHVWSLILFLCGVAILTIYFIKKKGFILEKQK